MKHKVYKLSVRLETDWDKPDGILTHEFTAKSWAEAEAIARASISYSEEDLQSALDGEFDYNWCSIHKYTPWPEMTWQAKQAIEFLRKGQKPPSLTAELEEVSESRTIDIGAEFYRQNKLLGGSEAIKQAERELIMAKAKLAALKGN
jgi:hypothetical protein